VDKEILKLIRKWSYFVGNILVEVKDVYLLDCPLVLSLLKHRSAWETP